MPRMKSVTKINHRRVGKLGLTQTKATKSTAKLGKQPINSVFL